MNTPKNVAIIGSTGSIGRTVLKIISKNKSDFNLILLTANKNYKKLLSQTKNFHVKNVVITNKIAYEKFKKINKNKKINVFESFENLDKILKNKIDYTMSSIVGIQGLQPTIQIIKHTKVIAIANKESIICGWNLIKKELNRHKTKLIPVDSEHFSVWYALNKTNVKKIILTASGGSLFKLTPKKIKNIKINEVLNHPNWKMGNKITIDSSTLMNKVFEVIEAKNIFNIELKKIDILIHPSSYIHTIIIFSNGMIKIVAHDTTMEIPIFNSIYQNKKKYTKNTKLNINKLNNLELSKIDINKFPLIKILNLIPNKISLFETIVVSANDEYVRMYLNGNITYSQISKKLLQFIKDKQFLKFKKLMPRKLSDIINLDRYVRLKINPKGV